MSSLEERHMGCLLGLAAGDAVGTTVEFKQPGSFDPVEDMVGGDIQRNGIGNIGYQVHGERERVVVGWGCLKIAEG